MSNGISSRKITFIGGGQMAEALIGGLLSAKLCEADDLWATDPVQIRRDHLKKKYGIQVGLQNQDAVKWADVVVLAVKPQSLDAVLAEVGETLGHALVVSLVAGVTIRRIADACGSKTRVIRTMPNTPAMVHEGMTAMAMGQGVDEENVASVRQMFESVGKVVVVEERLMDAVTGKPFASSSSVSSRAGEKS